MAKIYRVGCAHCGQLVGEFDLEKIAKQDGIKNLPEHKCPLKREQVNGR